MANEKTIPVEVAYAKPEQQVIIPLQVKQGTTLIEAIKLSGILSQFPEIDLDKNKVGIFGAIKPLSHKLVDGDRIEIYRPVSANSQ